MFTEKCSHWKEMKTLQKLYWSLCDNDLIVVLFDFKQKTKSQLNKVY